MEEVVEIYKNMNKICTDIKQSKELIELGLDVNTADMYYMYRHWEIDENTFGSQSDASIGFDSVFYYGADNGKTYHYIPAWSLTALLDIIPNLTMDKTDKINLTCNPYYHCEVCYNDFVDAVFEMICWLKENGKL